MKKKCWLLKELKYNESILFYRKIISQNLCLIICLMWVRVDIEKPIFNRTLEAFKLK